ncbi:MAG: phage tail sheath subtilisin-like domain-containing protein [Alphaproteobacteria bacterium]|nr:phage tail sheath subtilisin-like domain-containing protein [Alphaproteobacteria bacterium]
MAGGTFTKSQKKVRPGTYINFKSTKQTLASGGTTGVVILPLVAHNWGPAGEFIEISNSAPDANYEKLGYSVYDDDALGNMLLIREALKNAAKVIVFIPTAGTKATATLITKLKVDAAYGGALGNDLKVAIVANADLGVGYFNVVVTLGTSTVDTIIGAQKIGDLTADGTSKWVKFSTTGGGTAADVLTAAAATALTTGANGAMVNADFTGMLDLCESIAFNTFAFPYSATTYAALCAGIKSKIKHFREGTGKRVNAVMAKFVADYEGCINVTNGVILTDGTEITAEQAVAYVAGITAAASYTQSNTYRQYTGAQSVKDPKTHDQAVAAINAGELFFSYDDGYNVVIEYDINSLTTFADGKDESYRKNRVMRVFDAFSNSLMSNFPPNKYSNDRTGWDVMEGIGRSILDAFADDGAITDVDPENDFFVDVELSTGDQTYFNCGLKAVDSAEKLFFTVSTR